MQLTSEKAMELINGARGLAEDDNWIIHSICVGNTAAKIAEVLKLDEDFAMTLEKRLLELITRYGVHENTVYHIKEVQKLKQEFDEMLGYNVYDLFPRIKENL